MVLRSIFHPSINRLRLLPTYGTILCVKTPAQALASPATIIFQSAKLGDLPWILKELDWAERLLDEDMEAGRIFGVSGGNLAALAFGLARAAQKSPRIWGKARNAPAEFRSIPRPSAQPRPARAETKPRLWFPHPAAPAALGGLALARLYRPR